MPKILTLRNNLDQILTLRVLTSAIFAKSFLHSHLRRAYPYCFRKFLPSLSQLISHIYTLRLPPPELRYECLKSLPYATTFLTIYLYQFQHVASLRVFASLALIVAPFALMVASPHPKSVWKLFLFFDKSHHFSSFFRHILTLTAHFFDIQISLLFFLSRLRAVPRAYKRFFLGEQNKPAVFFPHTGAYRIFCFWLFDQF